MSVGLIAFGRSSWAPAGYEPGSEAMKRGQQLHPSRAPGEPQSGFLGTVKVQFLDKVVDVSAVSASVSTSWSMSLLRRSRRFLRRRWVRQSSPTVATVEDSSFSFGPFFDKVVDMPVVAQLQYVHKVVVFPACRSCSFPGARREKTVLSHSCRTRKMVGVPVAAGRSWFPGAPYSEDGRCPCCGRSFVVPWCRSWLRRVSHSCVVENFVEIPESRAFCRDSAENCRGFWIAWFTPAGQAQLVPSTCWATATVTSLAALAGRGNVEGSKSDQARMGGNSLLDAWFTPAWQAQHVPSTYGATM